MLNIKENYEFLKGSPNILVDYDEILYFYPDYYRDKTILANKKPLMDFREFYTKYVKMCEESELYKKEYAKLKESGMDDYNINLKLLHENLKEKWNYLSDIVYGSRNSAIDILDLIDYVGHYPATYPVPKEEEINPKMEELLDKYDISVRYYLYDDIDKMQTYSDDLVRLIESAKDRINCFNMVVETINNEEWMSEFITKTNPNSLIESKEDIFKNLESFPESYYQKQGKSKREEGKHYQKMYVENYNR